MTIVCVWVGCGRVCGGDDATCRSRALPFPSSPLLFLSSSSLHLFTSAFHPLHHHHHHHCSRSSINSINPSLPSPLLSLPLAEVCPSIAHGPASSLLTELTPARRNALHTCNLLPLPLALSLPSSLPPRFFFHCFQQPGNGTLAIVFSAALTCAPPTAFYSRSTVSIDRFDTSSQPARQPAPSPFRDPTKLHTTAASSSSSSSIFSSSAPSRLRRFSSGFSKCPRSAKNLAKNSGA